MLTYLVRLDQRCHQGCLSSQNAKGPAWCAWETLCMVWWCPRLDIGRYYWLHSSLCSVLCGCHRERAVWLQGWLLFQYAVPLDQWEPQYLNIDIAVSQTHGTTVKRSVVWVRIVSCPCRFNVLLAHQKQWMNFVRCGISGPSLLPALTHQSNGLTIWRMSFLRFFWLHCLLISPWQLARYSQEHFKSIWSTRIYQISANHQVPLIL